MVIVLGQNCPVPQDIQNRYSGIQVLILSLIEVLASTLHQPDETFWNRVHNV
jgi:hypothetical protein